MVATSTKIYRRVCVCGVCGTQVYTHDMYVYHICVHTAVSVQVHNLYHHGICFFLKIKQVILYQNYPGTIKIKSLGQPQHTANRTTYQGWTHTTTTLYLCTLLPTCTPF